MTMLAPLPALAPLVTPRLILRPPRLEDAAMLTLHLGDVAVTRWLARVPHPYTREEALSYLARAEEHGRLGAAAVFALTIRAQEADALIGVVALHGLPGRPEFGYWLGRPYWGHGLMGEAASAVIDWARRETEIPLVHSGAFAGNTASLRIQARLGFAISGISQRFCRAENRMKDHIDTLLVLEKKEAADGEMPHTLSSNEAP